MTQMRTALLTLALGVLFAVAGASPAPASPATVNMRVEGRTQTLFEGQIRTEGHSIEASSDTQPRSCDATNGGAHAMPGPTPTAAAVDAMALAGQTFDGQWSAGFDDYFITRWGPDKQSVAENEYWGVLVNQAFTSKGACQYELADGDQVLWVYNAFSGRPFLSLSAGSDDTNPPAQTATAQLGEPFTVKVGAYTSTEGAHHDLGPYEGAAVSPVSTAADGFQTVEGSSPATVLSGVTGTAAITFTTPGWHRLKAAASGVIRSNRLDVCVPAEGAGDCGALPPDDRVRQVETTTEDPGEPPDPGNDPSPDPPSSGPAGVQGPAPSTPGSGPQGGAPSDGRGAPRANTLRLRGLVMTPIDDRAGGLTYGGRWRAVSEPGAWLGTVSLGGQDATLTFHLAAGRPVLIVRDVRQRARIAIQVGRRRQILTIPGRRSDASRLVLGARRPRAGAVRVHVLKGTVGVDGVAVTS